MLTPDTGLVERYDRPGPRYTSYPTALQFDAAFGEAADRAAAERSRAARPGAPLSVYVHVPFCTSPCFYCGCNRIIPRQWGAGQKYLRALEKEIERLHVIANNNRSNYAPKLARRLQELLGLRNQLRNEREALEQPNLL